MVGYRLRFSKVGRLVPVSPAAEQARIVLQIDVNGYSPPNSRVTRVDFNGAFVKSECRPRFCVGLGGSEIILGRYNSDFYMISPNRHEPLFGRKQPLRRIHATQTPLTNLYVAVLH